MRTLATLDEVVTLLDEHGDHLFVRWSKGPDADEGRSSRDGLTGVRLPGLSANPLAVEPWWGDRSPRLWVARRLHDYRHLAHRRGPGVRPWVLIGKEAGRGPDNEPLVECREPLAWIGDAALAECEDLVAAHAREWGPLDREGRAESGG
ncbi:MULTISPECIES: DUF6098 family protein [unclassified Saccharothrix]|uniref:DUF6098 family protein n=1 Tax=unclassified Saccharothrix TaxID=2593673 RepID=UPI00307E923B